MPTYDYNVQQRPPSGANVGMDLFGVTLEQIMKRRHEQQLREAQDAEAMRRAQLKDVTDRMQAGETARHHGEMEARAVESGERDERRLRADVTSRKAPYLLEDNLTIARMFDDPEQRGGARAPGLQAPSLQLQPPAAIAGDVPERTVPPPVAAPPVDPLEDAVMQGRAADAKRRQDRARGTFQPLVKDEYGQDALEYLAASAGTIPEKEWGDKFEARRKFLEGEANAEKRAYIARETAKQKAAAERPAGTEDIKELGRLENDIANIDRMIAKVESAPDVADEYVANYESWTRKEKASEGGSVYGGLRKVGQGIGLADVAPEQALSPNARELHKGITRVQNSIAKGYGGVVTDSDRGAAASEMGTTGASAEELARTLRDVKGKLETSRRMFLQNKRVDVSGGQSAPQPAAAQGGVDASIARARALKAKRAKK